MGSARPLHFQQSFSQREVEILRLIKEGLSNQAIAQKLSLSLGTVKWYNRQVFGKLGVNSRTQAVEKAIKIGLIMDREGHPKMGNAFPHSVARSRHNLPAPLTSFIGRIKERTELRTLLHGVTIRLVTILGAGGTGKTRLALRVAEEALPSFAQGVWLVELAPAANADLVPQLVAKALGIRDSGDLPYEEALACYLFPRSLLLVLDNCEHLAGAVAQLATHLLTRCPNLRILATSREALEVEGEVLYPLSSMAYPDFHRQPEPGILRHYDAVQLFVERVRRVCPGFMLTLENGPAIAQICRRLDGIPLALELAAVRANVLSVDQIAARLADCFTLLVAGGCTVPRHQTMKTCLDWSFNLLSEPERLLLSRLAVFAGGWTLEAAEEVCTDCETMGASGAAITPDPAAKQACGDVEDACSGIAHGELLSPTLQTGMILDLLNRLVNQSMVLVVMDTESRPVQRVRYRLLEPIRQYALEKLKQAGEVERLRDRHLVFFTSLAERTALRPFQKEWPSQGSRLKYDWDNLRSALEWALAGGHCVRIKIGLRLACSLESFWLQASLYNEGRDWMSKALALSADWESPDKALRALALEVCGSLEGMQNHINEAKLLLEESVVLFREVGDDWRLSLALSDFAMSAFPVFAYPDEKMFAIEESLALARQIGDPIVLAIVLQWRAHIKSANGMLEEARCDAQESYQLFVKCGAWGGACFPLVRLGYVALEQGDIGAALRYHELYLRHRPEIEDLSLDYYASYFLLETSYYRGDYRQMEEIIQNLLDASLEQNRSAMNVSLCCLGFSLKCQGEYSRSAACFNDGLCIAQAENDERMIYNALAGLAGIAARLHQPVRAARLYGAVEKILESSQCPPDRVERHEFAKDAVILHEALGAEAFSQAWMEGRAMGLERAIKEGYAIAEELVK